MKKLLESLYAKEILSEERACDLVKELASGECPSVLIAAVLSAYRMRPLKVSELSGFRKGMLELARSIDLSELNALDIVGTGGDGKNTFNISTLSAFLIAACGQRVAKHGNYSVSSVCGSSNVLEALGVQFSNDEERLKRQLKEAGICFLHAPLFHPAMKHVASVRRELGVKTFFNLLGPLVNPAAPSFSVLGVSSYELVRLYAYVLQQTKSPFMVLHSLDGYDEISLTGSCKVVSAEEERILEPEDFGFSQAKAEALSGGGTIDEAVSIFKKIIEGKGTQSQNEVVSANAGLALHCANPERDIATCAAQAHDVLCSGGAMQVLETLLETQD